MFHYNSPTPGWSTHNFLIIYTKVFRAWSFSKGKFHRWVLAEILLLVQGTGIFISHLNFIMELKKKKRPKSGARNEQKLSLLPSTVELFQGNVKHMLLLFRLAKVKNELIQCLDRLENYSFSTQNCFESWAMVQRCWFHHVMDQPHNLVAASIVHRLYKLSWQSYARAEGYFVLFCLMGL